MSEIRLIILWILATLMWITIGTSWWLLFLLLWLINAIIIYFKDIRN